MRVRIGRRVGVLAGSLVLLVSGLLAVPPPGSSAPDGTVGGAAELPSGVKARVPRRYEIIQMNLCLHHVNHRSCFDYGGSGKAKTPFKKRREAVKIINKRNPNVVTLNEMCRNDLRNIARRTGMQWRFSATEMRHGRCAGGRGRYGIALMARKFNGPKVDRWWYHDGNQRRGMCARTAGKVLLCTSHLQYGAPNECRRLRGKLSGRKFPVVFGGDVNRPGEPRPCRTDRMWGRSDWDCDHRSCGHLGVQHVYVVERAYRPRGTNALWMRTTDHPALVVRMRRR